MTVGLADGGSGVKECFILMAALVLHGFLAVCEL